MWPANGAYIRTGGGKLPPGAVLDAVWAITHPGLDGVLIVTHVFAAIPNLDDKGPSRGA